MRTRKMSYSHFTLKSVAKQFNLQETVHNLFPTVEKLDPSAWLQQTLEKGSHLALKTEKARSEMIIAPILLEMLDRNHHAITLFSGETLDVDNTQELNGECDFILSKSGPTYTLQAPIFALVEAKQHIIESGLGQCVAQMVGARLFNQMEHQALETIFGGVSSGEVWQFLKLEQQTIVIDDRRYFLDNLELLLGVLQKIIDVYL